eukprot:symbB.v1.2.023012.t1/scaffold2079.1/size90222/5
MEAAVKELKDNIRQSARRAEEQIDARVAEVAQSLQQLEMEKRELQKAKRELEEERAPQPQCSAEIAADARLLQ